MSESMLNKKIGRYELKEVIGEGAMAVVYRAYDPEINRSVACKILKADHCVDEEYTSRFLRESKAAGALSHASIVTIYDVGEIDGAPYIMMELIEGKDLGEVLNVREKLSIKDTLVIALNLARALDYAHSANIVHRDIKPDNIILLSDSESIKVADFGIARVSESDEAQKTQVGSVLGTPRYMSPEQALGENIDGRSDLFSVGTIMYEMLTGKKAFDAENMGTLMMQISQKQPEPLKKLNADIPIGLRQIVQKLLQKSPDKRFQNGAELAKALSGELNALHDQQEEQTKHKYIPLRYKWTLSAAAIVTTVLLFSMNIMFGIQSTALTQQAVDSGSSLAKFIATETSIPLLSEDWITLETQINDAAGRDTFSYLIVADRNGVIRASSDPMLINQPYQEDESAEWISKTEDVYTTSSAGRDGGPGVFNIETPVLFQDTEVGKIVLGVSQASLDQVKNVTGWLMFFLGLITVSAVAVVMFTFAGLISKPMKAVSKSMRSLENGDFDARISLKRSDEIGKVFDAFNQMAASIQARYTRVADELASSGIQLPEEKFGSEDSQAQVNTNAEVSEANLESEEPVEDVTMLASSLISKQAKMSEDDDATILVSSLIGKDVGSQVTSNVDEEDHTVSTSNSTVADGTKINESDEQLEKNALEDSPPTKQESLETEEIAEDLQEQTPEKK